jgi:hypothetical protein
MITALIVTDGRIEPLAATLAALVPGVAEGLVADAVVIARRDDPEIIAIADAVGAAHVTASEGPQAWSAGAAMARREWLLCLQAGDVPVDGWISALERFVAFAGERRIARLSGRSVNARAAALRERLFGASRIKSGHLVHRALLGKSGLGSRVRPVRIAARIERQADF